MLWLPLFLLLPPAFCQLFTAFPPAPPFNPFATVAPFTAFPTVNPFAFKPAITPIVPFNPFDAFTTVTPFPVVQNLNDENSIDPVNTTMRPINIDPEAIMNVPEIINHWGYPVETHDVVTEDGYILQLHRIPHGRAGKKHRRGPPVLLQHGLLCTSSIWLLNLPSQSAGFVFADAGFDVWLGNVRGNVYSKRHTRMDVNHPDFWKFSWQEMARYDMPAMVDYILNKTEREHLYFVGHSQGTLTMFALLDERPEYAQKVRQFHALAPVGRMGNVQGMFKYLGQIYEQFNLVYTIFGDNEFLSNNILTRLITNIMCDSNSAGNPLCENFIFSVSGPNSNQFNSSRVGIYLAHNPAGTSARNMVHFAQMVRSKRMQAFDRGREGNLKMYGQPFPPEYNLRNISSPVYLFYSDFDWLANSKDVESFLMPTLSKGALKLALKLKEFNHNDFLWGMRARSEIYDRIVNIIKLDNRRLDIQRQLKQAADGHSDLSSSFKTA